MREMRIDTQNKRNERNDTELLLSAYFRSFRLFYVAILINVGLTRNAMCSPYFFSGFSNVTLVLSPDFTRYTCL